MIYVVCASRSTMIMRRSPLCRTSLRSQSRRSRCSLRRSATATHRWHHGGEKKTRWYFSILLRPSWRYRLLRWYRKLLRGIRRMPLHPCLQNLIVIRMTPIKMIHEGQLMTAALQLLPLRQIGPPVHPLHQWSSYSGNLPPSSPMLSSRHSFRLHSPLTSPADPYQPQYHVPGLGQPIAENLHDQGECETSNIHHHQGEQQVSLFLRRLESPDVSLLSAQTRDISAAAPTQGITVESNTSSATQGKLWRRGASAQELLPNTPVLFS